MKLNNSTDSIYNQNCKYDQLNKCKFGIDCWYKN